MKQRTYTQNPLSKRVKVDFGPFCPVFGLLTRSADFMQVEVLINTRHSSPGVLLARFLIDIINTITISRLPGSRQEENSRFEAKPMGDSGAGGRTRWIAKQRSRFRFATTPDGSIPHWPAALLTFRSHNVISICFPFCRQRGQSASFVGHRGRTRARGAGAGQGFLPR
jgi:hypothetical protein